jgi:hypothetical protein
MKRFTGMLNLLFKWLTYALILAVLAACANTQAQTPQTIQVSPTKMVTSVQKTGESNPEQTTQIPLAFTETPTAQVENQPATTTMTPPEQGASGDAEITPTSRIPPAPDAWKSYPIVPTISAAAHQIYLQGLKMGRDPHAFSKVGDCQVNTERFLEDFDLTGGYRLGVYTSLQEAIDWFKGSFGWRSLAARDAMTTEALFNYQFADPESCQAGEGPLACEYRVHNPSIAIISLEQTWKPNTDIEKYSKYLRKAIEYTISQDIVPILATKADNLEGDNQINQIIAELAWEYEIPLWNFWLAVQPLPNHGLMEKTPTGETDMFHLTAGNNYFFDVPDTHRTGWTMRNLTALQTLDSVWRELQNIEQP